MIKPLCYSLITLLTPISVIAQTMAIKTTDELVSTDSEILFAYNKELKQLEAINLLTSLSSELALPKNAIGFDVATFLTHAGPSAALDIDVFAREWGVDFANHPAGGVTGVVPQVAPPPRQVTMLQRKTSAAGKGLGKSTGWAHRIALRRRGVQMITGVQYERIDDYGLHIHTVNGPEVLTVDTVVLCAGQTSERALHDELAAAGVSTSLIGGAYEAAELDAKAAIHQACHLAAEI